MKMGISDISLIINDYERADRRYKVGLELEQAYKRIGK